MRHRVFTEDARTREDAKSVRNVAASCVAASSNVAASQRRVGEGPASCQDVDDGEKNDEWGATLKNQNGPTQEVQTDERNEPKIVHKFYQQTDHVHDQYDL